MDVLVEREAEVAALHAAVAGAIDGTGSGSATVVVGPPGIGKSALLQTVAVAALRARGGELEQEYPYGVIRQLFEGALRRLSDDARAEVLSGPARPVAGLLLGEAGADSMGDAFALEHAFYWLTAHLAERAPLVLVIDDAHWSDLASLRVLLYLVRRIADLPVAVVIGARLVDDSRRPVIDRIISEAATVLEPAALSTTGVGQLVHRQLEKADDSFCAACHSASGGNPFLVSELIGAVQASGIDPVGSNAARVRSVGAQSVMRSVLLRLEGLSQEARAIARTLAVLGESLHPDMLAELAEVPLRVAPVAVAELSAAHIVEPDEPTRFIHSIVRDAVYGDVAPLERSRLHRGAATALAAIDATPDAVASHLLQTIPAADAWTVERLVAAAGGPTAAAAPEAVATYLDRALRESVPDLDRAPLHLAMGGALFQTGGDAVPALRRARELAPTVQLRLEATRALGSAYMSQQRIAEAWQVIDEAILEFADEPTFVYDLEIFSAQSVFIDVYPDALATLHSRIRAWRPDPAGMSGQDRSMLALQAWLSGCEASPSGETAALARAALSTGRLVHEDVWHVSFDIAVWALIMSGSYDEAMACLDVSIDSCLAAGRLLRAATLLPVRAELRRRLGQLTLAREDARFAFDVIPAEQIYAPLAAAVYAVVLMEMGDLDGAWQVLVDRGVDTSVPVGGFCDVLLFARGRLRIAHGNLAGGVEDLLAFGAFCERMERRSPGYFPWRSTAVGPLVQLGRHDEALALADQEFALAESTGVGEHRGRALTARGLAGPAGVDALTEAVAVLETTPAALDTAEALLSLGRALRREGKRDRAREELRTAADLATKAGAARIADAARDELTATGARPRRSAVTGVGALTPSESRVASLAARGLTNREIAHSLFVTPKTVETHLAGAYRKLGISGKGELSAVLAEG